jgi:AcrR family transcriptional regulator
MSDTDSMALSRRDLAVERSLDSARERAEVRVQRFLDAAIELVRSDRGKDFTVQEVVERSGQSLRSFYQYFGGKRELLLAIFEESVRHTAEHLREVVDVERDPLARLEQFAREYHSLCVPSTKRRARKSTGPAPAIAEFALQLLIEHPDEAARAFAPLVELTTELVTDAVASGQVRDDIAVSRIVGSLLESVMFSAFAAAITADSAREAGGDTRVWELIVRGIGAH